MQLETVSSPSLYLADYFILILTCGKKKKKKKERKKKTGYFEFTVFVLMNNWYITLPNGTMAHRKSTMENVMQNLSFLFRIDTAPCGREHLI